MKLKVPSEFQKAYDRLMKSVPLKLRRNDVFKKATLAYLALSGITLASHHVRISQNEFPAGTSLQKFAPILEPAAASEDELLDDDEEDETDDEQDE